MLVGAAGFEPAASCSQSRRATRLRYAPISKIRTPIIIVWNHHQALISPCHAARSPGGVAGNQIKDLITEEITGYYPFL